MLVSTTGLPALVTILASTSTVTSPALRRRSVLLYLRSTASTLAVSSTMSKGFTR